MFDRLMFVVPGVALMLISVYVIAFATGCFYASHFNGCYGQEPFMPFLAIPIFCGAFLILLGLRTKM